jgi:hypothetical protein
MKGTGFEIRAPPPGSDLRSETGTVNVRVTGKKKKSFKSCDKDLWNHFRAKGTLWKALVLTGTGQETLSPFFQLWLQLPQVTCPARVPTGWGEN